MCGDNPANVRLRGAIVVLFNGLYSCNLPFSLALSFESSALVCLLLSTMEAIEDQLGMLSNLMEAHFFSLGIESNV